MPEKMFVFELDIRTKKFKTYIYNQNNICFDTIFEDEKPVKIESDNIKIFYYDINKRLYLLMSETIYDNENDIDRPRMVREIFELMLSAKDNIPSGLFTALMLKMNIIKKIFKSTEKNIGQNKVLMEENKQEEVVVEVEPE